MKIYWRYGPAPSCLKVPEGSQIQFAGGVAYIIEPDITIHEIPIGYITVIE